MKFFINDAILRKECSEIKKIGNHEIELVIPNYLEDKGKYEDIKFLFQTASMNQEDILLDNISLKRINKNIYCIRNSNKTEKCMYALLRSREIIPDDVFVPVAEKDKIKVLRKICLDDMEVDMGFFLSNVYLLEIKLGTEEEVPIYLAGKDSKDFSRYYIFSRKRNGEYKVSNKYNKHISAKECEMISLSDL